MSERPTFIVHLTPTADCTDPIKALRELLKRALRSWGLRCIYISENSVAPAAEVAGDLPASTALQMQDICTANIESE